MDKKLDAENTLVISENIWTSGQLSAKDIQQLPQLSVRTIINLALPTASNALAGEAELVTGLGINYFQIPVPWEKPEAHHLQLFFHLMDANKGNVTWVHCAKNMRVSSFNYLYRRLRLQQSDAECLPQLHAIWQPNEIWSNFISGTLSIKNN